MTSSHLPRPARVRRMTPAVAAAVLVAGACSGGGGGAGDDASDRETPVTTTPMPRLATRSDPLPVVTPTPRELRWLGPDVEVSPTATVVAAAGADAAAVDVVVEVLEGAGATDVRRTRPGSEGSGDRAGTHGEDQSGDDSGEPDGQSGDDSGDPDGQSGDDERAGLTVHVGSVDDADLAGLLDDVGVAAPDDLPPEGYALAAFALTDGSGTVVLAGSDAAGMFYAAQTLRQLTGDGAVAGVGIVDRPAMGHRGTIEGFYGSPWTTDERLDLLDFHGRFKLNTYIYAPKDDPFHRDQWRDPYPPDRLAALRTLAEAAAGNHVRFTFAVSPGVSICYSDPADLDALTAKLEAVYALGVRSFSIALDDIDHTRWNCDGDAARYGPPSTEAAARAQVELLNAVQSGFIASHADARPLQMVPTEYRGTDDSPYRTVVREQLDPAVEVMWTGAYVVPDEITVAQAEAAAGTFGRRTYVWDNTPVNDFPATEGRLILAPYARREPGLSAQVTGVVLNPMNQAAASKVQLVGGADFSWNDDAYDAARAHRAAADLLAAGDPRTVEALLAFFDLENLAPTSARSGRVSQPQAPALAAELDTFRAAWSAGDRQGAIDGLRRYADRLAAAPGLIRAAVADAGFVADSAPWLDATALWGQALVATLDGLAAGSAGDTAGAAAARSAVDDLVARASTIRTIPGETRPQGVVRVGDGVLDTFIAEAHTLL
ncbi:MAG TPA: beta-N-acetylglucosaminidase domain-containing protein [Acidimicrobiales bacterium]|nr:beta-N-acetylglucosaminidase domain-containing protein [Acidimicrobiales bacterium]